MMRMGLWKAASRSRLDLDLRPAPADGGWMKWLVILLAVALLWNLHQGWTLHSQLEALKLAAVEPTRLAGAAESEGGARLSPESNRRLREARGIAQRLAVPWPDRFAVLRRAHGEGVVLIGVDIGATGETHLQGRAANLAALFDYRDRLKSELMVTDAWLRRHGQGSGAADDRNAIRAPVAFDLAVVWEEHIPMIRSAPRVARRSE